MLGKICSVLLSRNKLERIASLLNFSPLINSNHKTQSSAPGFQSKAKKSDLSNWPQNSVEVTPHPQAARSCPHKATLGVRENKKQVTALVEVVGYAGSGLKYAVPTIRIATLPQIY